MQVENSRKMNVANLTVLDQFSSSLIQQKRKEKKSSCTDMEAVREKTFSQFCKSLKENAGQF